MKREFNEEDYAEFIMENAKGLVNITNGEDLLVLIENGYMLDDYLESIGQNPYDLDL